jgi:hypothetical protein
MNSDRRATIAVVVAALAVAFAAVAVVLGARDGDTSSPPTTASSSTTSESTPTTPLATTSQPATTGSTGSTATTAPAREVAVLVYFLRDEHLATGARTVAGPATARGAMEALLAGPDGFESGFGITSAVPAGTALLDLDVDGGLATVDLSPTFASGGGSASMQARVAQVVYTLTQFETVQSVRFLEDGEPVEALGGEGLLLTDPQTRADWFTLLPDVFVETPAAGATITSPVRLEGLSLTFEATWRVEVVDGDGVIVATEVFTAGGGTEFRPFDEQVAFTGARPGLGELVLSYDSARDGSRVVVDEVPVRLP